MSRYVRFVYGENMLDASAEFPFGGRQFERSLRWRVPCDGGQ